MGYHIQTMTNRDPRFYPLMGPFLARREITAELGAPVYDDDGLVWFIACATSDEPDKVLGFAAIQPKPDVRHVHFCHAYVRPIARQRGIYTALLEARLAWYVPGMRVTVTANESSRPSYTRHGFTVLRQRGRYFDMVLAQTIPAHGEGRAER
jgi:GNAT superfamily N-acetyltransferase